MGRHGGKSVVVQLSLLSRYEVAELHVVDPVTLAMGCSRSLRCFSVRENQSFSLKNC